MSFQTINIDIQVISGSQSIRTPDSFKIDDNKVYLKKVGSALYMIPFHDLWQDLRNSIEEFSEDYMDTENSLMNKLEILLEE